jgi:hypothetical protein
MRSNYLIFSTLIYNYYCFIRFSAPIAAIYQRAGLPMKKALTILTILILSGELITYPSACYAAPLNSHTAATFTESDHAVYIHFHHSTPPEVIDRIKSVVTNKGYAKRMRWHGNKFSCSVAAGIILNLQGEVTNDLVIIEKSSGTLGKKVLKIFKDELNYAYPQ